MLQEPCDLRRSIRCSQKSVQDPRDFQNLRFVLGRLQSLAPTLRALLNEVVNQANAGAFPDGQDLVFAVGVKRNVGKLGKLCGAGIDSDLTARMPDPQPPAAMQRRERHHQRAEKVSRL